MKRISTIVVLSLLAGRLLHAGEPQANAVVAPAGRTGAAPETAMGKLAASMRPGELKELGTNNCNHDLFKMWYDWEAGDIKKYGSQKMFNIICWNNDMKWDPQSRQILVLNGGHYSSFKFITYSADDNAWKLMPVPPWMDPRLADSTVTGTDGKDGNRSWPRSHLYDRLAISPQHRLFAVNMHGLYLYNIDKTAWSPRIATSSGGKDAFQVIEYFPEMNAFVYECNWGRDLRLWDVEKQEERRVGSFPFGIHGVMEYNPVHKVMLFGAGDDRGGPNPNLYRLDDEGIVTKLNPPPIHINCTPTSKFMCDPVSGEHIVKGLRDEKIYAFHPIRDEWKEIPGLRFPEGESLGAAVSNYGVLMLLHREHSGNREFRCWLYKHRPMFAADSSETAP
ncbi:MAG: hypothetical protein WD069_05465 [Planctomycetales bacterium]